MIHYASPSFWQCYHNLPKAIQNLADKNYRILKANSNHPSLHFKKIKSYFTVRIGIQYRALGIETGENILWFWIGSHADYDKLLT